MMVMERHCWVVWITLGCSHTLLPCFSGTPTSLLNLRYVGPFSVLHPQYTCVYRIAGNFRGVQFSRSNFRGWLFQNCSIHNTWLTPPLTAACTRERSATGMSLLLYSSSDTTKLPDPRGPLSTTVPSSSIESANAEVKRVIKTEV